MQLRGPKRSSTPAHLDKTCGFFENQLGEKVHLRNLPSFGFSYPKSDKCCLHPNGTPAPAYSLNSLSVCACMCVCMCVCVYVYAHVCVSLCVHMCMCMHTRAIAHMWKSEDHLSVTLLIFHLVTQSLFEACSSVCWLGVCGLQGDSPVSTCCLALRTRGLWIQATRF